MRVLGIETSCDDTGVAIYDSEAGLLVHHLASQIDLHKQYGGVVPELAARDHIKTLMPLIDYLISSPANAGIKPDCSRLYRRSGSCRCSPGWGFCR